MITMLGLSNFKCFKDQSLEMGGLTLLTGLNGMGKSSAIQALLLLRQSYQQGLLATTGLSLNGDLARVGTARDALFEGASEDVIGFGLELSSGLTGTWRFSYNQEADVLDLISPPIDPEVYQSSLFNNNFHYLHAERLGPRASFEMSDFLVRQQNQLGPRGEYTAHFLAIFGNKDIPNENLHHPRAASLSLKDEVAGWISEVSPGTRLQVTSNPDLDLVGLRYSFITGSQESNAYRATNVGFGLTYTLPILVATLAAIPGTLLLIENPEAHLHPRGQAVLGDLLARTASCGIQVVIESHSDHVLNGIRIAVHDGKVKPEQVQLHYFARSEYDEQANHSVSSPHIDQDGRIDHWPEGFFDEWDKSLEALLEPRSV